MADTYPAERLVEPRWPCGAAVFRLHAEEDEGVARGDRRPMIRFSLLALLLSACQFMPGAPTIDCGSVPAGECNALVQELMDQAREAFPGKQVASIRLSTPT